MADYTKNTQSRKWLLTINHPQDCGLSHDRLTDLLQLSHPDYFCMADEIAGTGTYHTHVYLFSHSPIRFGTLKARFPTAHIDKASGTSQENRDYIRKEGKWAGTEKQQTSVEGTFLEVGTLPDPAEETAPKMHQLLQDVEAGLSNLEIIKNNPGFAFKSRDIDVLRETMTTEEYQKQCRTVQVHYWYGETGSGKTRSIYETYPAEEICRITSYQRQGGVHFDAYHGQKVLVLEEFHSQIPIADLLNYLDVYPIMLPARYNDRVACYSEVYITSNIALWLQYPGLQQMEPETWKAFLRRINDVQLFQKGQPPRRIIL